jgi:hypothetical protein
MFYSIGLSSIPFFTIENQKLTESSLKTWAIICYRGIHTYKMGRRHPKMSLFVAGDRVTGFDEFSQFGQLFILGD